MARTCHGPNVRAAMAAKTDSRQGGSHVRRTSPAHSSESSARPLDPLPASLPGPGPFRGHTPGRNDPDRGALQTGKERQMIRKSHLLLALALVAAAVAAPIAHSSSAPKVDPLAVGYLIGQGLSPSQVTSWTTGACSQRSRPPLLRDVPADPVPKVDPLAVGYLIGQGLSPSQVTSWTTGACSQQVKAASCYAMLDSHGGSTPSQVALDRLPMGRRRHRRWVHPRDHPPRRRRGRRCAHLTAERSPEGGACVSQVRAEEYSPPTRRWGGPEARPTHSEGNNRRSGICVRVAGCLLCPLQLGLRREDAGADGGGWGAVCRRGAFRRDPAVTRERLELGRVGPPLPGCGRSVCSAVPRRSAARSS